jgi:hypothetical protein
MITIAQSLGRKNEKPSFLGLGFINSPLEKFFSPTKVWKTQQHFFRSPSRTRSEILVLAKVVFLLFFIVPNYL